MTMIKMAELLKYFVKLLFNKEKKKKNPRDGQLERDRSLVNIVDERQEREYLEKLDNAFPVQITMSRYRPWGLKGIS